MLNPRIITISDELHSVIDNLACPFAIFKQVKTDGDSDFVCSYMNKRGFEDILLPEEVVGKKLKDIFPMNSQTLLQACRQVIKDKVPQKTIYSVKSDNQMEVKSFNVSISILNDSIALSWTLIIDDKNELLEPKIHNEILQNTDELFIKTFHANPDGFIISRMSDGKILEINRSAETLFQYSRNEMIGRTSAELGLIANLNDREKAVSLLKENGFVRDFTMTIVRKSGEIRQVSLSIEIIDVEDEKLMITSVRDITERKHMENALYESEKRYRSTLDNMMEGCAIIGFDWKYLYVNEANARHAHRTPKEMIGRTMFELIPGVEKSIFFESYKRCMEERTVQQVEAGFTFEDGSKAWYQAIAQPVPEGIFILSADITERKKAEEELKKSQQILRLILDHVNEGIIVSDAPDGKAVAISRWGANYTIGRSVNAIIDLPVESYLEQWDVRDINTREKIQPERLPVYRALRGEVIKGEEILIVQPDGTDFIILANAVPIYNEDKSRIVNVISTWIDITNRKKSEEALRQSEERFFKAFINSPYAMTISKLPEGIWTYVNDSFLKLTGFSREELIDHTSVELNIIIEQEPEQRVRIVNSISAKGNVTDEEIKIRTKSGEIKNVILSAVIVQLDGKSFAITQHVDITGRKKTEAELKESEKKYRELFTSMNEASALVELVRDNAGITIDYIYFDVNPTWERMASISKENAIGKSAKELFGKVEDYWLETFNTVYITGEPIHIEQYGGGMGRYYSVNIWKVGEDRCAHTFTDITERKNAENAVKKANEQYDLLFNSINEGFAHYKAVFDDNGKLNDLLVLEINPAGAVLSGVKREDQIGKTWKQVWNGIEESLFDIYGEIYKTGEPFIFEHYSGITKKWYTNRIYKIGRDQFAVTFFDITERILAEEALKESQTKLLDAQKLAHFGSYSIDLRHNKIEWSDELYNIWELDKNKPIPPFEELWNRIHPDDRESLKVILTQKIKNESQVETEFRIIFPDKRIKYINIITRGFFDESGNLIRRQGVEIDITEKKMAMLELERTLKELELSNRDIEQYAYVTSHDLKEPIRMMSSYAQLLENKYKNKLGHNADLYLNFIREGASRLYLLINDLVNYLQIGNTDRIFLETDINKIIYSVIVSLNQTLKESRTHLIYNDLPVISADPQQMKQLFYNLIDNAIKFRSNSDPIIEIKCREDDKEWLFSVKDNGMGFKQEYSEIIFSVFQRLNSREDYKGNGVGLAICKRIIGHHNGRIWVESEQGVGSVFYFSIPKTKRFYENKEGS